MNSLRHFSCALCVVFILTGVGLSSDFYMYDRSGQRIDLTVIDTMLAVRPQAVGLSMDSVSHLEPSLGDESTRLQLPAGFWLCKLIAGSNVIEVGERLQLLLGHSNVSWAADVLVCPDLVHDSDH